MHVRLARTSDAESIRSIYNAEVTGSTATFDLVPRTPEEQLAWLADHRGPYPAVVAVDDGTPSSDSGHCPSTRTARPTPPRWRTRCTWAATTAVRGWAGPFSSELIELATQHGFHSVIARIGGDNTASIALHQACGFTMVGVEREVGRKFNRWLDVTVLQRLL